MDRLIGAALWTIMTCSAFMVAAGVSVIANGARLRNATLIFNGVHLLLLALATLVIVVTLHSIRKRLLVIEAKLNDSQN